MIVTASLILFTLTFILYFYFTSFYGESYWKKRNVPFYGGKNLFAFWWSFLSSDKPLYDVVNEICAKYPGAPAVAVANMLKPTLIVTDHVNIKHIITQDFKSFVDRHEKFNEKDILADNIVLMKGLRWKLVRQKLSPLFTSSKLKNMFNTMNKSAEDYVECLRKENCDNAFDSLSLFCCAALTASIFGVSTNSIFDSPFLKIARESVKPTISLNLRLVFNNISPFLFTLFNLKVFGDYEKPFIGAIKEILKTKRQTKSAGGLYDFGDLALSIQNGGTIKDDETGLAFEPTDELLAAQAFFFLIAGVDPSTTGLFFTLYELANNPDMQLRVQAEIETLFQSKDGRIDFDDVNKSGYMDNVLDEALRMYPPMPFLNRICTEATTLPVGNIKVEKKTNIMISVYDLHRNPELFPEPEVFDPSRFANSQKPPMFIPFGEGGRSCLGARFARLQIKAGLIHILRHFNVRPVPTKDPKKKFSKTLFGMRPDELNFKFDPRIIYE